MDAMTTKPSELIARYIELRSAKQAANKTYEQFCKEEFDDEMDNIEAQLLNTLNTLGTQSIKSKNGTAMKVHGSSVTTADGAEFRRHIIGLEAWDLVDWRPNKTAIDELIKTEPLPPGLNRTTFINVRIRKASAKGDE
jgi:hypothetical protein